MQTCLSRRLPLVFLMISLAAAAWAAQSRPDFSGTWSQIEPALGPKDTHVERLDLHDATLTIEVKTQFSTAIGAGGGSRAHSYTIGGPAETRTDRDGRHRSILVTWDGPALVFVRTIQEGCNTTTEREVWSVSEDGKKLTKWRETTNWKGTRRSRTVLERR